MTYRHLNYTLKASFRRALTREQRRGSVCYWYEWRGGYALCLRG